MRRERTRALRRWAGRVDVDHASRMSPRARKESKLATGTPGPRPPPDNSDRVVCPVVSVRVRCVPAGVGFEAPLSSSRVSFELNRAGNYGH
jgi:hypothetical protein